MSADELRKAGRWSSERDAQFASAFDRAANAALRAPVLAERAVVLRRIAKRIVPLRARPMARKLVARLDALSRSAFDAVGTHR